MPRAKPLILYRIGAQKQKLKEVFSGRKCIENRYITSSLDRASIACMLDKRLEMIYFLKVFGNTVPESRRCVLHIFVLENF